MPSPLIIDVHTHIYPPSYLSLLASRTAPPQLLHPSPATPSSSPAPPPPRLIILPSDAPLANPTTPPHLLGRPLSPSYSSIPHILSFMRVHNISLSVLSLANPWLDFLPPKSAPAWATQINDELNTISASSNNTTTTGTTNNHNNSHNNNNHNRILAFGCLPLSAPVSASVAEIHRITTTGCCPYIRGIIIGTAAGLNNNNNNNNNNGFSGLDDPSLDPIWSALQHHNMPVFIHPHYGLPDEVIFGPPNPKNPSSSSSSSGHVLPLSLGFPLETTIAFTRMWLAGTFDRFPRLQVLLAHAGGGVPVLAGRIESCVLHERAFYNNDSPSSPSLEDGDGEEGEGKGNGGKKERVRGPKRALRDVLRENVWLDAVGYGEVGLRAAVGAVGRERVLFGTDHPFFPPLGGGEGEEGQQWESVRSNLEAVGKVFEGDQEGWEGVMGGNARRLFLGVDDLMGLD